MYICIPLTIATTEQLYKQNKTYQLLQKYTVEVLHPSKSSTLTRFALFSSLYAESAHAHKILITSLSLTPWWVDGSSSYAFQSLTSLAGQTGERILRVERSAVGVVDIFHGNLHVCVVALTGAHALRSNEQWGYQQWYMMSLPN